MEEDMTLIASDDTLGTRVLSIKADTEYCSL
jgi:hypothetical protein